MVKSLDKGLLKKIYISKSELLHIRDHIITHEKIALKEDPPWESI